MRDKYTAVHPAKSAVEICLLLSPLLLLFATCEPTQNTFEQADPDNSDNEDATQPDDDDNLDIDDGFDDDDNDDYNSDDETTETDSESDTEICAEWDVALDLVPTRMLLLQDVSSSMTGTKWDQAKAALKSMLSNFDTKIEFGFDIFPTDANCQVDGPLVSDTLPGNASNLTALIDQTQLSTTTPLYRGMQQFIDPTYAPLFSDTKVSSYLVIVSDGADSCGIDGNSTQMPTPVQFTELTKQLLDDHEIKTFAIGFGGVGESAPEQLNAIAAAGGTPYTEYIDAQDQAALEAALDDIAAIAVSCIYEIGEQDEEVDKDKVNFFFDDEVVGFDKDCAQDTGWTWVNDEKTNVEFCEAACAELNSGSVSSISAEFGCEVIDVIVD